MLLVPSYLSTGGKSGFANVPKGNKILILSRCISSKISASISMLPVNPERSKYKKLEKALISDYYFCELSK